MAIKSVQVSFAGGVVSPAMFGRVDDQKYKTGLAKCENFVCSPQGAVFNRPGFEFVRATKYADKKTRLIPFKFSSDQTMVIEFGDKYARFHTNGATLMSGNSPYEIATPYEADDLAEIKYTQSADVLTLVHTKYPPKELKRYSAYDWRLETIDFALGISAPTISGVTYHANGNTSENRFNVRYVVTALKETDEGTIESGTSTAFTISCNLYHNESNNVIQWGAVTGANRYRVYKSLSGVYGYIGETNALTFTDDNIAADESITPPRYDTIFQSAGSIQSATITNAGTGYVGPNGEITSVTLDSYEIWRTTVKYRAPYYSPDNIGDFAGAWSAQVYVVDDEGTGSGAVVQPVMCTGPGGFERLSDPYDGGSGEDYYIGWKMYSKSFCYVYYIPVKGLRLVSGGSGYKKPRIVIEITGVPVMEETNAGANRVDVPGKVTCVKYSGEFRARAYANGFTNRGIIVTDPTGRGAVLTPEFANGKLTRVNILDGGQGYTNPTATVYAEYGSGAAVSLSLGAIGDYPGCVTYYEQRRFFGGTRVRPQMLWGTRPGTESDMSYTIPTQDDNRIKFRIAAQQASRVQHLVPISQLLALTETAEFRITSVNSDALTPNSISVKPQSYIGASPVQPVIINNTAVYAASRGGHLRELGYNWQANGFITSDLSIRAPHLFELGKRVVDLSVTAAPEQIIWGATNKGELYGLTYLPEQNVGAWHVHTTKDGYFESCAVVTEGEEDRLYVVVRRLVNGAYVRYVERMGTMSAATLEESFYVDSGLTYRGVPVSTLQGLNHLEGCTVAVLGDGAVMPPQKVKNGKITLPEEHSVIHVGLPITAELQTLPIAIQLNDGSYGRGHTANINKAWLQVYRSSGIWVGPSFEELTENKQRTDEPYGAPPNAVTGTVAVLTTPSWKDEGKVCVRQADPLPLKITGLTVDLAG